jgi:hypothetical protein
MTDDDVNTDMTVQELKTAIIDYQEENYPDDEE